MEASRLDRFSALMAAMGEVFGGDITQQKIEIYDRALSDIPIDKLESAVWQIIKTRKTASFPKVGEIREAISGDVEDIAQYALRKLEAAMARVGAYRTVIFDDPIIHSVVERFECGWPGICQMPLDEWKWGKKDFLNMYAHHSKDIPETIRPLEGLHDINNRNNGHTESLGKYTTYIGNKERAKELLGDDRKQITENEDKR